jgi:hypothetical protein
MTWCRPAALTFQEPDQQAGTTVQPQHAAHDAIVQEGGAKLSLKWE